VDETIWTIGHSTRPIEDFIALLRANEIETVADVRRYPGSRRHPQYDERSVRESLEAEGIDYVWIPALGGRRVPRPDSPNIAWRNEAFRGYADHIATEEFAEGLFELLMVADGSRTAIMCSEAVWWRCHRSLISDVLRSLGMRVLHIVNAGAPAEHEYTAPARIVDGHLTYANDQQTSLLLT
jgi:uncharacterized protein (DUF488 family)